MKVSATTISAKESDDQTVLVKVLIRRQKIGVRAWKTRDPSSRKKPYDSACTKCALSGSVVTIRLHLQVLDLHLEDKPA